MILKYDILWFTSKGICIVPLYSCPVARCSYFWPGLSLMQTQILFFLDWTAMPLYEGEFQSWERGFSQLFNLSHAYYHCMLHRKKNDHLTAFFQASKWLCEFAESGFSNIGLSSAGLFKTQPVVGKASRRVWVHSDIACPGVAFAVSVRKSTEDFR